jgi:WhiB family redox-sensing transcriptional regulator
MAPQEFPEDHSWAVRAACVDHPALPWSEARVTDEMRAICGACPVKAACLAEALAAPDVRGVWAGTTPAERKRLRPAGHRRRTKREYDRRRAAGSSTSTAAPRRSR